MRSYFKTTSPKPVAGVVCPTPSTPFARGGALAGIVIVKVLVPCRFAGQPYTGLVRAILFRKRQYRWPLARSSPRLRSDSRRSHQREPEA